MHLIREHVAYGWGAGELALNHPQLTLGEVYAVLSWYADHAPEADTTLELELASATAAHAKPENWRLSRLFISSGAQRMAAAFYFVQHVPATVARRLRLRSVDLITAFQDGNAALDDELLLERATLLRRLFVTQDEDFLAIASAWLAED